MESPVAAVINILPMEAPASDPPFHDPPPETCVMPDLLIRNLPDVLYRRLQERADAHGGSAAREARRILEDALMAHTEPPSVDEVDSMRVQGPKLLTDELVSRARAMGRP